MRNYTEALENTDFAFDNGHIRVQPDKDDDDFVVEVIDTTVKAIDDLEPRYRAILRRHPLVAESQESKYFDIVMATDDLRDVKGFIVAGYNSHLFATQGILGDDVPTIVHEGMAIHNPYADETYGEWMGDHRTDWGGNDDGRAVIIIDPHATPWADKYDAWRDIAAGHEPDPNPAP